MGAAHVLRCPTCSTDFELTDFDPERPYSCALCLSRIPTPRHTDDTPMETPTYLYGRRGFQTGRRNRPPPEEIHADASESDRATQEDLLNQHVRYVAHQPPLNLDGDDRSIGRYQIIQEIARGGMGVVYLVSTPERETPLALKVLLSRNRDSSLHGKRFQREANAMARLRHPSIVPIHDVGESNGRAFFTMEFVKGVTLARALGEVERLPVSEVLRIGARVARAAHHAHEANVVHRDLKPGNVILTVEGLPIVTDFGLALELDQDDTRLTEVGQVLGTAAYMPPEQALGQADDIGPWTDIYAIGALIFEMATGRLPYQVTHPTQVLLQMMEGSPPPIRELVPELPAQLEIIVSKALARRPKARFTSALKLAEDLERMAQGETIHARAPSLPSRLVEWCWRHQQWVAGILLGVVLVLSLALFWWGWQLRHGDTSWIDHPTTPETAVTRSILTH